MSVAPSPGSAPGKDPLLVTKLAASVLTAGIIFMLTGMFASLLINNKKPAETAIAIANAPGESAAAPAAAPDEPIEKFLATADASAGEALTKKLCSSCHTFNDGGKAGVGPNLYGVLGAPHGHMKGFNYSSALTSKTGPWTYDELNAWLTKPAAYSPGTRMSFAGLANEKQRADIIVYLRSLSANPEPLPAAP